MTHVLEPVLARRDATVALRSWAGGRRPRVRAELTYADLADRVERTAAGLARLGLGGGRRALFSVRPRPAGVVLAFGVVRAGASVVFVDPGSTPELFAARVRAARPSAALTESVLYALSRGPLRRVASARGLLLPDYARLPLRHVHAGVRLPGVPRVSVAAAALARTAGPAPAPPGAQDEALVVFTSGTTAQPKAVVHTGGTLHGAGELLRAVFALEPGDVVHTDQMLLGVPALLAGATWSVPAQAPARDVVGFAAGLVGAAGTYLVPADLTALLDAVEDGRVPPVGPRVGLVGGAPVTRRLLERAVRVLPGTRWVGVYGMTEVLPVAVVEAEEKIAYDGDGDLVGRPLPGVTVRVDAASPDGVGELVVGGPSLMAGYLHDVDAGHRPSEHRTGDLARLDGEGRVVLVGRTRDMIIRGTTNIYPGLFEPRLAALPGVGQALLVGVPRDDGDERVVLVLVPDDAADGAGAGLDPHHPLVGATTARLPGVLDHDALPDLVVVTGRVPLSGRSRKPDRSALARAAAALAPERVRGEAGR